MKAAVLSLGNMPQRVTLTHEPTCKYAQYVHTSMLQDAQSAAEIFKNDKINAGSSRYVVNYLLTLQIISHTAVLF